MQAVLDAIGVFFGWINSLGATVMLPIALFLIGLAFRVKAGSAFVNALKVGIGFFGLNVMIGVVAQNIGPLASAIV
jgi:PTS system galactitol-specific IIC component